MNCTDSFFGFKAYCEELIEEGLKEALDRSAVAEPMLSAARHAVFPGGKRIRPLLALLLCRDAGGDVGTLLPVALSLELIHCASLIHDDLPALDNDDFRRGRPACHKAYGEATAILAGDFLIALAQKTLFDAALPEKVVLKQAELLARSLMDICSGQQLDLCHGKDRASLDVIHVQKTGALFETACKAALLAASCSAAAIECGGRFGLSLGLLFQIVDDYIDIFGSSEKRGKPVSSDISNCKETFFNRHSREEGLRTYEKALNNTHLQLEQLISTVGPGTDFSGARFIVETVCSRMK